MRFTVFLALCALLIAYAALAIVGPARRPRGEQGAALFVLLALLCAAAAVATGWLGQIIEQF